jgi:hypothetical protein
MECRRRENGVFLDDGRTGIVHKIEDIIMIAGIRISRVRVRKSKVRMIVSNDWFRPWTWPLIVGRMKSGYRWILDDGEGEGLGGGKHLYS